MRHTLITGFTMAILVAVATAISANFQPWSENVFQHIEQEYGPEAEERFRFLHQFIIDNQHLPDMEKVEKVNVVANHLPWIADSVHWKNAEYWASPLETLTTFGGDCEDIAFVKWVVLRNLGIPADHLALAYVKLKETGENHMVLLYLKNPEAEPGQQEAYVLDNYVDEVKKGSERTDLFAVMAFNADGKVVLFSDDGTERTIKETYEQRKIRKLEDLKAKIRETREQFKVINEGRPLMPEG